MKLRINLIKYFANLKFAINILILIASLSILGTIIEQEQTITFYKENYSQKLFNISNHKLDILVHPNSLVHAIIEFKNGLVKFMYHETSMIIPLANAIFDGKIDIENFYQNKDDKFEDKVTKNLNFYKVNNKIFPLIKLKNRILEFPSTPIIINAANEILVDHFLNKKLQFLGINKIIMSVLNDRNYKKYAIRKPKNINHIIEIDKWARETADKYVL